MIIILKTPPISLNSFFGTRNVWLRATIKKYFKETFLANWPVEKTPYPFKPPYHICYSYHKDTRMDVDNLIVIPKLFQDAIQPWLITNDKLIRVMRIDYNSPNKGEIYINLTCVGERNGSDMSQAIVVEVPECPALVKGRERQNKKNRERNEAKKVGLK